MNLVINDVIDAVAFSGFDKDDIIQRVYKWRTEKVNYDTGLEQRNQVWSRPIRNWLLNWYVMDNTTRQKLIEIFNRARGMYEVFRLYDSEDYAATYSECSITAVGGETTTQLVKAYYVGETETWTEKKRRIMPSGTYTPTVKIDAATKTEGTHYTLDDDTGIIDWTGGSAPNGALGAGEVVTADFQFHYPVKFASDEWVDDQIHPNLYDGKVLLVEELE